MSQLTFKEEDVKNLKSFLEFLRDHARFDVDMEENIQLSNYVRFMQAHVKRVNDHIMELVSVKETAPVSTDGDKS